MWHYQSDCNTKPKIDFLFLWLEIGSIPKLLYFTTIKGFLEVYKYLLGQLKLTGIEMAPKMKLSKNVNF